MPHDAASDDAEEVSVSLLCEGDLPPHAASRAARGLFTMAVSGALMPLLHGLDETMFSGSRERGTFTLMNGQGDFTVFVWDECGVVAASFDHEMNESYDVEIEDRQPLLYFPDLPASLGPLVTAAIEAADHDVTGGIWLTDEGGQYASPWIEGEIASAANLLEHLVLERVRHADDADDDEARADDEDDGDEDAVTRIARTGVVEPEDAGALFRACGREPSEAELVRTREKLAELGITWADPVRDWKRF